MEDEISSARLEFLGFKPQREIIYNTLLPYSDKIDEEALTELRLIQTNLLKCLLARELTPGFFMWTERLKRYIKLYGWMFSKEDHINFIKMYLEVLNIENQEVQSLIKWCTILLLLLKKRYLLTKDDLQIEWRLIYNHYKKFRPSLKTDLRMIKYTAALEEQIFAVGGLCRTYFPASATQEILQELSPHLCPLNGDETRYYLSLLDSLLPTCVKPEEAPISYDLWFTNFMRLWESCSNDNKWEHAMMSLMARLSYDNVGYIDFEPYIPMMYSRFIRSFQLPVYYKKKVQNKAYSIGIDSVTFWIVSTLNHKKEIYFEYLEKFINMIKSFLYTANTGSWTTRLQEFINKLSFRFVRRILKERNCEKDWENEVPEDFKLSDADIDRFVLILRPCLELAMFSRSTRQSTCQAFRDLATLRPKFIIPWLLDKLYASLGSLTEPRRLTSAMTAVSTVTRQMAEGGRKNYPEGPTHIIPLLMALLPGIDPNDFQKFFSTCHLILQFISMVPIINSSEAANYYDDLTEEEHIICEATAGFEDFVVQFLDKICIWVESCSVDFVRPEQQIGELNVFGGVERMSTRALYSLLPTVLRQCSPEIFSTALKKVFNFVSGNVMEVNVAGKYAAILCSSFTRVNPKESLKLFVPYLCNKIESLLDENPNIDQEERFDGEILYNLLILSEVVDGRNEIIDYLDLLKSVLDRILLVPCPQATKICKSMLTTLISTLLSIQSSEKKSSEKSYSLHVKDFLPVREWAYSLHVKDLKVEFYIPKEKEFKAVEKLIHYFLIPELNKLDAFGSGEMFLSRTQLQNSLEILHATLMADNYLPMWDETPLEFFDTVAAVPRVQCFEAKVYALTMPDGSNIRKKIADTLECVQEKLLEIDEGYTKCLIVIANIYKNLVLGINFNTEHDQFWSLYIIFKKISRNSLDKKLKLRPLLIDRVEVQQMERLQNSLHTFSETHKRILMNLFNLSISRYREVRQHAQLKLGLVLHRFSGSYTLLTDKLKEILRMNTQKCHVKFKGGLYILLNKHYPVITVVDWKNIYELWPLLVNSMPSEKESIINLIAYLSEVVSSNLETPSIDFIIPDQSIEAICKLYGCQDVSREKYLTIMKNKSAEKRNYYNKCVDLLLKACHDRDLHWRYHLLALGFLRDLVHPDIKYNKSVIKYFLGALISDSVFVRKVAIKTVVYILIQNKLKYIKLEMEPSKFSIRNKFPHAAGNRDDNKWLLYDSNSLPKNSEQWNEPKYLHSSSIGYNTWPNTLRIYSSQNQPRVFDNVDQMSEEHKEIYSFFKREENVSKLIYFFSMEGKKGKDHFNCMKGLIFKYLSMLLEDKFLDIILPHLEILAIDTQESSQICAAEIMYGLMRGSKHWKYEATEALWHNLIPVIQAATQNTPIETVIDWLTCLNSSFHSRDSRRYYWLLQFLLDDPLSDTTSLIAGTKMHMLTNVLLQQPWRNSEPNNRFLEYLKGHMTHPFQLIRTKISNGLKMVFSRDYQPPDGFQENNPKLKDFFDEYMPSLNWLYHNSFEKIGNGIGNGDSLRVTNKEDALRLFKIVSKFIVLSLSCEMNLFTPLDYYRILPLTCVLQSCDVDDEIQPLCIHFLALLAQALIAKEIIPSVLVIFESILKCPLWSARTTLAEFLTTFVFHNMALLSSQEEWILKIQSYAIILLEDTQLEVRNEACTFLSGLLHCNFLPSPAQLLAEFKQKAKNKMKISVLGSPRKRNLLTRHSGILGLCAFIKSSPYDIPEYLPDIFQCLGPHLSDPPPIPDTIREALGHFKRTHQDDWEAHRMQFTEEQLLVFQDLTVPPSYYV